MPTPVKAAPAPKQPAPARPTPAVIEKHIDILRELGAGEKLIAIAERAAKHAAGK